MKKVVVAEKRDDLDGKKKHIYDENWRYDLLTDTDIFVYSPYKIVEREGEKYIVSAAFEADFQKGYEGPALPNSNEHSHYIAPLKVENLIFEAVKIDLEDEKSIIDFCNKYGVLGELRQKYTFQDLELTWVNQSGWKESLEFFKNEIYELKKCFNFHIVIEAEDGDWVKELWGRYLDNEALYYEAALQECESTEDRYIDFLERTIKEIRQSKVNAKVEDIKTDAKGILVATLNRKLPNVFFSLQMTTEGRLIEGVSTFTLAGALYYQLYQHIVKGNEFKVCKYCGDYYVPRKSDTEFCPAEESNEHSKCANAYNAMVRRAREWHFKKGISVHEIQKKIKRPGRRELNEIQTWIESYKGKLR